MRHRDAKLLAMRHQADRELDRSQLLTQTDYSITLSFWRALQPRVQNPGCFSIKTGPEKQKE
jgi:hypothetical protein